MTLPDFTSQMLGYMNTLLGWPPLLAFIAVGLAMATVGIIVAVLMRGIMRG